MSNKELFDIFYAIPNPHFNAYFEAMTGPSEKHPLEDLIEAAEASGSATNATAADLLCAPEDGQK